MVSYNTRELLARCLESLLAQGDAAGEIVVVDNASNDGSAQMVREQFPAVRLIANTENRGFGAACNQGIRATSGRYVALVNPDCEVEPGSLTGLARFMDAHPRAAVAGGRLRYGDGTFQHSSFRFPTLAQVLLDYFPINWRLTESRLNGRFPRAWDGSAFEIDHPLGAFFCVRRAAAGEVGLFDESYFMYAEEVDWCFRFKRAGWEVWHCPDASAIHYGGRSTRQRAGAMFVQLHRSRLLFFRKHYPPLFLFFARAIVWLGMARRLLALGLFAAREDGPAAEERRAQVRACLEVIRL